MIRIHDTACDTEWRTIKKKKKKGNTELLTYVKGIFIKITLLTVTQKSSL